jgi:hypothetical protein
MEGDVLEATMIVLHTPLWLKLSSTDGRSCKATASQAEPEERREQ